MTTTQNGAQENKLSKLQAMLSESEARQNQAEIMIGLVVQFLEDIAQFLLSQSQVTSGIKHTMNK